MTDRVAPRQAGSLDKQVAFSDAPVMHRAAVAAGLVVATLCLQACGTVARSTRTLTNAKAPAPFRFGTFAGYEWLGDTRQAAAVITVPRVAAGSAAGEASAWIGVQREGHDPVPFVQVGVLAQRSGAPASTNYQAFWSDSSQHFRPLLLFRVASGDLVQTRLRRGRDGWLVSVHDLTSGVARALIAAEQSGSLRAQVKWIQEDPGGEDPAPYPAVQGATFASIAVNGTAPRRSELAADWMSPKGTRLYLAPSSLYRGSFHIAPRSLSAPAIEWIHLTLALEAMQIHLWDQVKDVWDRNTPLSRIRQETKALVRAEEQVASRTAAAHWPPATRPAITRVLDLVPHALAVMRNPPSPATPAYRRWRQEYLDLGEKAFPVIRRLDEVLGLPYYL